MTISFLEEIKKNVYILSETEQSDKTDLQIESYVREILAYCYRDDIIEPMVLPVSEVIASTLNSTALAGGFDGNVSSYKEGDMQITFGSNYSTSNGTTTKYNGKLEGFKLIRGLCDVSE